MERVVCFFLGHKEDRRHFVIEVVMVVHRHDGMEEHSRAVIHATRCARCGTTVQELRADGPRVVIDAQVEDVSAGA